MTTIPAILISLLICGMAAVLEGVCAGKNVKAFFATLRFPRYSAPLWVWTIIGGAYYLIFFSIIYRLLRLENYPPRWYAAVGLIVLMMTVNGLTNYVIFRARNLYLSFVIGAAFPMLDLTLFVLVMTLDQTATLAMIPYLLYRVYAVLWGYGLWKLNRDGIQSST
jgi:tryptophan-rich sensory protein